MGGQAALGPQVGASQRLDVVGVIAGRGTLVQHHGDVRAQLLLHLDDQLGCEAVLRAVEVGAKGGPVVVHPPQLLQGKDLEAAAVGEDGPFPAHEAMQPAQAGDSVGAGAQVQVVGVGQDHGGVQLHQLAGREALDRGLGAHGTVQGGGQIAVGRVHQARARPRPGVGGEEIEGDGLPWDGTAGLA